MTYSNYSEADWRFFLFDLKQYLVAKGYKKNWIFKVLKKWEEKFAVVKRKKLENFVMVQGFLNGDSAVKRKKNKDLLEI